MNLKKIYCSLRNTIILIITREDVLKEVIKDKEASISILSRELGVAEAIANFYKDEYKKQKSALPTDDPKWTKFFYNWIMNSPRNKVMELDPVLVGKFVYGIYTGKIPKHVGKQIWIRMLEGDVWGIGKTENVKGDPVADVINENPELVKRYKSGKLTILDAIVGKAIKLSNGTIDHKSAKARALEILNDI